MMPNDRVIEETVARCTAAMVCYHNAERSFEASESMRAEIRAIADQVASWGRDHNERDAVLHSVRRELLLRYGHEAGFRIFAEFGAVFESAMMVSDPEVRPNRDSDPRADGEAKSTS